MIRDIAAVIIVALLVTAVTILRDIRIEVKMLNCVTLAENGIRCPAIKEMGK